MNFNIKEAKDVAILTELLMSRPLQIKYNTKSKLTILKKEYDSSLSKLIEDYKLNDLSFFLKYRQRAYEILSGSKVIVKEERLEQIKEEIDFLPSLNKREKYSNFYQKLLEVREQKFIMYNLYGHPSLRFVSNKINLPSKSKTISIPMRNQIIPHGSKNIYSIDLKSASLWGINDALGTQITSNKECAKIYNVDEKDIKVLEFSILFNPAKKEDINLNKLLSNFPDKEQGKKLYEHLYINIGIAIEKITPFFKEIERVILENIKYFRLTYFGKVWILRNIPHKYERLFILSKEENNKECIIVIQPIIIRNNSIYTNLEERKMLNPSNLLWRVGDGCYQRIILTAIRRLNDKLGIKDFIYINDELQIGYDCDNYLLKKTLLNIEQKFKCNFVCQRMY